MHLSIHSIYFYFWSNWASVSHNICWEMFGNIVLSQFTHVHSLKCVGWLYLSLFIRSEQLSSTQVEQLVLCSWWPSINTSMKTSYGTITCLKITRSPTRIHWPTSQSTHIWQRHKPPVRFFWETLALYSKLLFPRPFVAVPSLLQRFLLPCVHVI